MRKAKVGEQVLTEDGKTVVQKPLPGPVAGDAIFAPLATGGPDTLHRKTMSYVYVAFGPKALITPAIGAAFRQAFPNKNYPPEWKRGIGAFGRTYGSDVGTKTTILTTRYAVGALTHEDFRYRPTWMPALMETMRQKAAERAADGGSAVHRGHSNDIMLQLPKSDKGVGASALLCHWLHVCGPVRRRPLPAGAREPVIGCGGRLCRERVPAGTASPTPHTARRAWAQGSAAMPSRT